MPTQYLSTDPNAGAPVAGGTDRSTWDRRADGSQKGDGFLGVLTRPDGSVSSEISIGVNLDGKEVEIPTLVPTLTPQEVDALLKLDVSKGKVPDAIIGKAVAYARQRASAGKPYFAAAGEQNAQLYPQFARAQVGGGYLSTDPSAGAAAAPAQKAPSKIQLDAAEQLKRTDLPESTRRDLQTIAQGNYTENDGGIVTNAVRALLPSTTLSDYWQGPAYAVRHSLDSIGLLGGAMYEGSADQAMKAKESAGRVVSSPGFWPKVGAASETLGHTAGMVPIIGTPAAQAGERIANGDVSGGVGTGVGLVGSMFLPHAVPSRARVSLPLIGGRTVNPVEARAVAFAESRGIPVDAGTVTGRQVVKNTQKAVASGAGGAGVADTFRADVTDNLRRVGDDLTNQAHPTPVMPEQAGQGIRDAMTGEVRKYHNKANRHYAHVEAFERANNITVDVRGAKAGLRSTYERLRQEGQSAPLMGGKANALRALDRLMSGPDDVPLTVAESALSDFKTLSRTMDIPELRTQGQSVAARTVSELQAQVDAAAATSSPNAMTALDNARTATRNKYDVANIRKQLREEPVQVFNQATMKKDAGIAQLREIARVVPDEMPKVGRAYLERQMGRAKEAGGFDHSAALYSDWQELGPRTKELLFPDAAHRQALDDFFQLAKKLNENPNPSGTGQVLHAPRSLTDVLAFVPNNVIAKLLYTPRGVRALTQTLSVPVPTGAARAAALANLVKTANGSTMQPAFPVGASDQRQDGERVRR